MKITTKQIGSAVYYWVEDGIINGETWAFSYTVNNATSPTSALMTIAKDYETTASLTITGTVSDSGDSYTVSYEMTAAQSITLGAGKFLFSSKETFGDGDILKKVQGNLTIASSIEVTS